MPTTPSTHKVLTIDDEESIVDLIVDILESQHYQVVSATKWTDAIDALTHENPNLVLLDLKMPTIHGTSMLEFIRNQGFNIPVIVVSGFVTESVSEELYQQGVKGIIHKPFKGRELLNAIESVLGKPQPPKSASETPPPVQTPPQAPSQHNTVNDLYNRPLTSLPEPEESPSAPPSMSALYGTPPPKTKKDAPPTEAEAKELFQKMGLAPAPKEQTSPEQDILSALQKAQDTPKKTNGNPQTRSSTPPPDLLEALQKRELQQKEPPAPLDSPRNPPINGPAQTPEKPPSAPDHVNELIDPLLGSAPAPRKDPPPSNPFGTREPSLAPISRRRGNKGNLLFMGGITIVCILVAGILAIMQWVTAEFDPTDLKKQAQDAISNQVKDEVMKELQKQSLPKSLPQGK